MWGHVDVVWWEVNWILVQVEIPTGVCTTKQSSVHFLIMCEKARVEQQCYWVWTEVVFNMSCYGFKDNQKKDSEAHYRACLHMTKYLF